MQRIILNAQLTELYRSLRILHSRVTAAQSLVKNEAVEKESAQMEHARAGQSAGAWAGCWAGSDGGDKCTFGPRGAAAHAGSEALEPGRSPGLGALQRDSEGLRWAGRGCREARRGSDGLGGAAERLGGAAEGPGGAAERLGRAAEGPGGAAERFEGLQSGSRGCRGARRGCRGARGAAEGLGGAAEGLQHAQRGSEGPPRARLCREATAQAGHGGHRAPPRPLRGQLVTKGSRNLALRGANAAARTVLIAICMRNKH
ncbi:spidroin-1-like isoform X2 [Prinia subflava]|uniref:spidroin-1-like isoform X2 n=1 Tax=Prinia subflava TaxID=208062 RepID=UPI002FE33DAE